MTKIAWMVAGIAIITGLSAAVVPLANDNIQDAHAQELAPALLQPELKVAPATPRSLAWQRSDDRRRSRAARCLVGVRVSRGQPASRTPPAALCPPSLLPAWCLRETCDTWTRYCRSGTT